MDTQVQVQDILGLLGGLFYFYIYGFPNGLKKPPRLHPTFKIIPGVLQVENGMIFFYLFKNRYHLHHWFVSILAMILSFCFIKINIVEQQTLFIYAFQFFLIGFIHGLQVYIDRFEFLENI